MFKKGFSTLFAVIIVGAVSLSIVLALTLITLSSNRVTNTLSSSYRAKSLANACAEQGLMQIRNDENFIGTGSVTLGGQGCSYTVINAGGQAREIQAISTVNSVVRKVKVTINQIYPQIIVNYWQEVSDF